MSGYTGVYHGAFRKTDTNDTSVLTTVALTNSEDTSQLKFIGSRAFSGTGITGINVPASLECWDGAFRECRALSAIAIQHGIEKIANSAFTDCTNLTGINFKMSDVKEIGTSAFSGCTNLRLATLPDGVKKIGEYAFNRCEALMLIDLKGTEEIEDRAFYYCESLGEVTMNSVKKIGEFAFWICGELTEVDLPASLTEIGYAAFDDLQTINFAGTAEQWAAIIGEKKIWSGYVDLTVIFADGGSVTYPKTKS